MNCFLAMLVDCDVPNDGALEMQTTAEAREVAEVIGETTDHEWVHLPLYMTEAIRRFDAGGLTFNELRLPQPGQLRLSFPQYS